MLRFAVELRQAHAAPDQRQIPLFRQGREHDLDGSDHIHLRIGRTSPIDDRLPAVTEKGLALSEDEQYDDMAFVPGRDRCGQNTAPGFFLGGLSGIAAGGPPDGSQGLAR